MAYVWTEEPASAEGGRQYEVVDAVEYTSAVPIDGTRELAVADYVAFASDKVTARVCVLFDKNNGVQLPDVLALRFEMPSGRLIDENEG